MAKPNPRKSNKRTSPLVTILKTLVVPAFEYETEPDDGEPAFELIVPEPDSEEPPSVRGVCRELEPLHVCALPVDGERSLLRFSWLAGYLISDCPSDAILIGNLLECTPFHIRADCHLGLFGRLTIGCDLVVRADDAPMVERRLGELLQLANDLNWFFPLRLPHRLHWQDVGEFEIDWEDLPHQELDGFLDDALSAPPGERTPVTLLRIAQGLRRWDDVLLLLNEHPHELPRKQWAPLKCMALRQLGRWLPAIRAAKAGGIRKGRFPASTWLSPSYMHSLIEAGDDIEALRLLGKPLEGEPGFYHWLRGLAMHRAGDSKQASMAFSHYAAACPGDVLGCAAIHELGLEIE